MEGHMAFENENEDDFSFSKTFQFPSKDATLATGQIFSTPIILNIYGVILIFTGFFWSNPLPTREK